MRIVFMGSAEISCRCIDKILADPFFEVAAVVTQPDKQRGRNLVLSQCIVKEEAQKKNLKVFSPEKVNAPDVIAEITALKPEVIVVVAYGQILGNALLSVPGKGCINFHTSLLPAYRGAGPIQWAIANGEKVTGVTVMFMNEKMDEGDIVSQKNVEIAVDDTAGTLHDKLADAGGDLIVRTLKDISAGKVTRIRQDNAKATYARKLKKSDGKIAWNMDAEEIFNRVRGFNPWPMCWCCYSTETGEKNLRILKVRCENGKGAPGEIIGNGADGPLVATGKECIRLLEVQPEGAKIMTGSDFMRGHKVQGFLR